MQRLTSTSLTQGTVITYTYDASGNRLSRTITVPTPAEIVVEDSSTVPPTDLVDGVATLSFSATTVGQSASRTLTIRNTGQAPLTGLSATFDGAHIVDFSAPGLPATLAGGTSATVTLTFSPTAPGPRAAALHIASNDADENPFDLNLAGVGSGVASAFDEHLSFDNNQVPTGWTLGFPVGGPGRNASITNGRFEAREVDTYAGLDRMKEVPASADLLLVSYTGNITANYWGQGTQVRFLTSDGEFFTSFGKSGYGESTMKATVGKEPAQPWPFQQAYPLETGTYRISSIIEDGRITHTVRKEGSVVDLVNEVVELPGLNIHHLQALRLLSITTTGAPSWMDDISIRGYSRATDTEITVEDPNATPPAELADGNATLSLLSTAVGQTVSRTLTIRNSGQAPITGLAAFFDGANSADFSATGLPTSLMGGSNATMTLKFAPAGPGIRNATLHIANSDLDENPFDIALRGTIETPISVTLNAPDDIGLTADGYSADGKALGISVGFAPSPGNPLTVISNTSLAFISGVFVNLAQGQEIALSHGGQAYPFVADYYGGDGNDLVLVWRDSYLAAWGSNASAQLGDGSPLGVPTPAAVDMSGTLAGKSLTSIAAGRFHAMALGLDGQIYGWGGNNSGQLGTGTQAQRTPPLATTMTGALAGKTISSLVAGSTHSLALTSDGQVYAWGGNGRGQLGDGTTTNRFEPVVVSTSGALAGKTVTAIAAGWDHSLALTSDGLLVAWGDNLRGQLGDGTTTQRVTPVAVNTTGALTGKTVVAIASGSEHCLALTADGLIFGWGDNFSGQLGDGTSSDQRTSPVAVTMTGALAGKTITQIVGGGAHSLALDSDGKVYAWGYNSYGCIGDGTTSQRTTPVAVTTSGALSGKTIVKVAAGRNYSMALDADGKLYGWGLNRYGQIGDGTFDTRLEPVAIGTSGPLAGKSITSVACAKSDESFTVVIDSTGAAFSWGHNGYSQLGNVTPSASAWPIVVASVPAMSGKTFVEIEGGSDYSVALTADGQVLTWGENLWGQLGDGTNLFRTSPVPVTISGKTIVDVVAANIATFALDSEGKLHAWGYNRGIFGNGTTNDSNAPVAVTASGVLASKQIAAVAATEHHVLALTTEGVAYAWGGNSYGELGDGSTTARNTPVPVSTAGVLAGKTIKAVAAGWSHSLALSADGLLFAWGNNAAGQLGTGTTGGTSSVPVAINMSGALSGKTIVTIAAGREHSLVTDSDGQAYSWGQNTLGRTGTSNVPMPVSTTTGLGGKAVRLTTTGNTHAQAVLSDGELFSWGSNFHGQIGDGTLATRTSPTVVQPNGVIQGNVIAAGVGYNHSLAIVAGVPRPEIVVEQPAGAPLIDNTGTSDFGAVLAGVVKPHTYTIRNTGTATLTTMGLTLEGPNSGNFAVGSLSITTLAPGGATGFDVLFTPPSLGSFTANIYVTSNDADENPFDILLAGIGGTPAEVWRHQYFGSIADALDGADLATPMGDGISNLMKYALVLDPRVTSSAALPPASILESTGGQRLSISFQRDPVRNDISIYVEAADSPAGPWTVIASSVNGANVTGVGGVTETDQSGGNKSVQVLDTVTTSQSDHRFMRVRVTR